jgi:hypothetical protein
MSYVLIDNQSSVICRVAFGCFVIKGPLLATIVGGRNGPVDCQLFLKAIIAGHELPTNHHQVASISPSSCEEQCVIPKEMHANNDLT